MATDKTDYFNREISWCEFNARVLQEGLNKNNPLLERLKFLAITSSNFDEFFMVRIARLMRDKRDGDTIKCPSGLRPSEVLSRLLDRIHELTDLQYKRLTEKVIPKLAKIGFEIVCCPDYNKQQATTAKRLFAKEVFPVLTPRVIKPERGLLKYASNLKIQVAFKLAPHDEDESDTPRIAVVEMPSNLDRFLTLDSSEKRIVTPIEDVVMLCGEELFPGIEIIDRAVFRVTRDADMSVDEERDEDFMEAMAEVLVSRQESFPVRLEIAAGRPDLMQELQDLLGLDNAHVFEIDGPLDLKAFMKLCFQPGFDEHKIDQWVPQQPQDIPFDADLWALLRKQDVLLHQPYESYNPVVELVDKAADDPDVLAIKMTLYRTSGNSPIVKALARAARNGKQVTALVELKARFDEGQNIVWARELERAGVLVIYGVAKLKVHSKALLILRREESGIMRYAHLGTGNYNDSTAKLYADMGLMTTREDITFETVLFFNTITGYSSVPNLQHLVLAPHSMRSKILLLIDREIQRVREGGEGRIFAKMNSLVDLDVIRALYKASQAGVEIKLNVRGICCLVPARKGLSENIEVISVVDRYLEHTRLFYFHNGGADEYYLSSADWMTRNLSRRIELMFPVEDKSFKKRLRGVFEVYFSDNTNTHMLGDDGTYKRLTPGKNEPVRAQEVFYAEACRKAKNMREAEQREFAVRRKPPKKK